MCIPRQCVRRLNREAFCRWDLQMLNISFCAVVLPFVPERAMGTDSHIHMQILRKACIFVCCVDKLDTLSLSLSLSMHLSSFLSEGVVCFKDETICTGLSEPHILRPLLDAAIGCADKRKWKTIPIDFWLFKWSNDNKCSKGNVVLRDLSNDEENHAV